VTFWLWVCCGCAASAAAGFTFTRFAVSNLPRFHAVNPESIPVRDELPESTRSAQPTAAVATVVRERAAAATKRRAAATRTPAPTGPEPEAAKLALWARQIKAGERKMSIATDGCRVTWNRTCKHGHPSWLVRLGYLKRPRSESRRM
jgi:hypothetical protein